MHQQPRLIQDATNRYKLKVSLPGGRYQLSLDDRAVNTLRDDLERDVSDTVPEAFVPLFVAIGDAWFPREKDTLAIIDDLRSVDNLSARERDVFISYVTTANIPIRNKKYVEAALERSPIRDDVSLDDLQFQELPKPPEGIFEDSQQESASETLEEQSLKEISTSTAESTGTDSSEAAKSKQDIDDGFRETLQELSGVGEDRADTLASEGIHSMEQLAESRPVELASISGISEGIAAVAIEGAREAIGDVQPAPKRLANQTGLSEDAFEAGLNQLAAAGIPSTEAEDTLRTLYGPRVSDLDAVSPRQAYFLWEAGYRTPYDVVQASAEELENIYSIGEASVEEIKSAAEALLGSK